MMIESAPARLCRRRSASRVIAQGDLELRARGLDEPTAISRVPAPDALRTWARVLELSFVFAAAEEAMARIGVRVVVDVQREMARINTEVVTLTRLDVDQVFAENRATLDAVFGQQSEPPPDALCTPNLGRVVRAAKSLLADCPINPLELAGARTGLEELAHRCRLAYDGLTALIERNSDPVQSTESAVAAAGHAYAEGRLSIDEVAAVLGMPVPDAVALLEKHGFRRSVEDLRLTVDQRNDRLRKIREDRIARAGATNARPDWVAREVIASQRIEDIDARRWLRS